MPGSSNGHYFLLFWKFDTLFCPTGRSQKKLTEWPALPNLLISGHFSHSSPQLLATLFGTCFLFQQMIILMEIEIGCPFVEQVASQMSSGVLVFTFYTNK
jgi:hypothetical protein